MSSWNFLGIPIEKSIDLLQYLPKTPHQVVSMPLLQRFKEGMICFFFDEGEGISRDIQEAELAYLVLDGTVTIVVEQTENILHAGDFIVVPTKVAHSVDAQAPLWLLQISVEEERGINMNAKVENYIKNIEKSTVLTLKELVAYQSGRVASLTLVQRDAYTTTLMAMAKGTGVGPHVCEGDAMVIALDGVGAVTIGDKTQSVKEGECIVMPAGISHVVRGEENDFKMMLIVSKPAETEHA